VSLVLFISPVPEGEGYGAERREEANDVLVRRSLQTRRGRMLAWVGRWEVPLLVVGTAS